MLGITFSFPSLDQEWPGCMGGDNWKTRIGELVSQALGLVDCGKLFLDYNPSFSFRLIWDVAARFYL